MSLFTQNAERLKKLSLPYNPLTGEGSLIERYNLEFTCRGAKYSYNLPTHMKRLKEIEDIEIFKDVDKYLTYHLGYTSEQLRCEFEQAFFDLRLDEDFEFWAYLCAVIQEKKKDSEKGNNENLDIPFRLNKPQRKLLAVLEKLRISNKPIRVILDKARQWGGSTLVQMYFAWIQQRHRKGWNMAICTEVEAQASNIREKYQRFADNYPPFAGTVTLDRWQGTKHKVVKERDCVIQIGSMERPNSLRSNTFKLLHLSEVGLWRETKGKKPEDMIATLTRAVTSEPYTIIVIESTAQGVGNYFHKQWISAIENKSVYTPVFVAWYEDEGSIMPVDDIQKFFDSLDEYELHLWNDVGCCLEQIAWYRFGLSELNQNRWKMMEECPTTWQESFISSGKRVFPPAYVENMRKYCKEPILIGDIKAKGKKFKDAFKNIEIFEDPKGELKVWIMPPGKDEPKMSNRFIVVVDVGGKSKGADFSSITVLDRYWMHEIEGVPEVAADWHGHIEHDLLAWKGAQIATKYDDALYVIEVNSIADESDAEGDHSLTLINEVAAYYKNMYYRNDPEKIKEGEPIKYGFHTNRATKPMIVDYMLAALRDILYYEREKEACYEYDTYELSEDGKYEAKDGCHDDKMMSRSIAVYISYDRMPRPCFITNEGKSTRRAIVGDATI